MAIFDYVMLLISVVLSLGLARLLETHARLLKRGVAVRWSAVYLAWFAILGAMHVDLWATLWAVHMQSHWPRTAVLGFLFQAVALFHGAVLQRTIAFAMVVGVAWYFATYLPGFST